MTEDFSKATEQMGAFQKIWTESITQLMQTALTTTPNSAPPEVLREMRSGILKSLARSWDEFLRSPQFLDVMRQWMDSTITFRKMSNEWMARMRNDLQAPSRDDIDTIMLSVRHMEQRLLDRVEDLSKRIDALNGQSAHPRPEDAPNKAAAPQGSKSRRRASPANRKVKRK